MKGLGSDRPVKHTGCPPFIFPPIDPVPLPVDCCVFSIRYQGKVILVNLHRFTRLPFIVGSYRTLEPPLHTSYLDCSKERDERNSGEKKQTARQPIANPITSQKTKKNRKYWPYCDGCSERSVFMRRLQRPSSQKIAQEKPNFTLTESHDRYLWLWPLFQQKHLCGYSKAVQCPEDNLTPAWRQKATSLNWSNLGFNTRPYIHTSFRDRYSTLAWKLGVVRRSRLILSTSWGIKNPSFTISNMKQKTFGTKSLAL